MEKTKKSTKYPEKIYVPVESISMISSGYCYPELDILIGDGYRDDIILEYKLVRAGRFGLTEIKGTK